MSSNICFALALLGGGLLGIRSERALQPTVFSESEGIPEPEGSSVVPMDPAGFTYEHARHLLLRAGFGGTPDAIAELHAMGLEGAVRFLVNYEEIPDPLPSHGVEPTKRPDRATMVDLTQDERRRRNNMVRRQDRQQFQKLRNWWMERMLRSPRPLEEKMTLFWHGHFTSGYRDVRNAYHMALQNELLRRNATGNFGDLVHGISRDPAMLEYLDNNRNNRRAPNENYARELMELFTLGVGNYTETDIKEAARAFTGWTFTRGTSQFRFAARNHDYGPKKFLGQSGDFDGDDIIRIILEQDAAPRHVAGKVLAYLAVTPSDDELEPYAQLLRTRDYEIKPFLRTLFSSEWFYSDRVVAAQVKSPVMFTVNFLKVLDMSQVPGALPVRHCASIGQAIMEPPNVKGWDGGTAWITSSNLIGRYNITRDLISPRPAGRRGRGNQPSRVTDRVTDTMNPMATATDRRIQLAQRFSAYDLVQRAEVSSAEEIMTLFEKRFLATELAEERRSALIEFLAGTDGTAPLDLRNRQSASSKLSEFLHLLTTAPEFQIC